MLLFKFTRTFICNTAILLVFLPAQTQAQVELLATGGSSHFLGDLGGKPGLGTNDFSDIDWKSTRYMGGLGVRLNVSNRFSLRALGYYTRLSADDKYTNNVERRMRNLNFFSSVWGANAVVEYHFNLSQNNLSDYKWYVFAGGEYFMFNPKTRYNGQVVELQPLGTEGQYFLPGKTPYKLSAPSIPFGLGYKFKFMRNSYLSFQIDARKTFTDYIDDASTQFVDKAALAASNGQMAADLSDRSNPDGRIIGFSDPGTIRANPNNNDNFFFFSISYNLILGNQDNTSAFYKTRGGAKRQKRANHRCYSF